MLVELLPEWLAPLIPELSLIFLGMVVEKHYVSRVTTFTNSLALLVHFLTIEYSGVALGLYTDVGLLLGVIGMLAYLDEESLPTEYYEICYVFYSSLVVGVVILFPRIESFVSVVVPPNFPATDPHLFALALLVLAFIVNLGMMAKEAMYTGSRRVAVNDFIWENRNILVKVSNPIRGESSERFENLFGYK